MKRIARLSALALVAGMLLVAACGETRRPIGEECLRNDDCLSGYCEARACVSAPSLVTGANGPPPDEEPLLPTGEGGITDAGNAGDARDAADGG